MIQSERLMVGNYLERQGAPYRVIQIDGIVRDGWMLENGEEDCGEPIPIDIPMLQNNGFVWDGMYARFTDGTLQDEPLDNLLAELDRLDIEGKRNANSCKVGYAQKLYSASLDSIKDGGFKTVGQLLDRGSRWYSKCYGVGKKHVEKVDEALYNLYGIKSW